MLGLMQAIQCDKEPRRGDMSIASGRKRASKLREESRYCGIAPQGIEKSEAPPPCAVSCARPRSDGSPTPHEKHVALPRDTVPLDTSFSVFGSKTSNSTWAYSPRRGQRVSFLSFSVLFVPQW